MKNTIMALSLFVLAGCATQTFNLVAGADAPPTQESTHHFFLSGIAQEKQLDAAAVCGGVENISRVETKVTFLNGLLGAVTSGIYTPRTARVYCKL